ncbi:MAG: hypothetical protein PUK75_05070 [bacterium]|nr:hypothetical protein [bacterium]MDY4098664.1 hypothetical protein [Lachnospiraceae bacterium]
MKRFMKRKLLFLLIMSVLATFMPQQPARAAEKEMNIHALYLETNDKGESVLVESQGNYLLMDLGSYGNLDTIIRYLKKEGITQLDLYFSHLHLDHCGGGLVGNMVTCGVEKLTASGISIRTLYLPDPSLAPESSNYSEKYRRFREFMHNENIVYLKTGDEFTVGDAKVQIVGPVNTDRFHPSDFEDMTPSGDGDEESVKYTYYENNCALVAKVSCGSVSYLSMSDVLEEEVAELVKENKALLKADILKLSHHGTGSGSTEELMAAVQPSYAFAQNTGLTGKSSATGKWLTNIARKRSVETGMCYLVANEKKNLIYEVKGDQIRLYENQIDAAHMLKGWVRLTGGDGEFRCIDRYYFDDNGQPLTGVQKVDGHYFYFGKGGCMQYGNYSEAGVYQGWKSDDDEKRYFTFSPDKEYAYMAYGFTKIGKQTFYFDENGNKVDGNTRTILKKIGKYKYGIGKSGAVVINNWATIGKDKYYFDKKGRMVSSKIVKIKGASYYFGKDGKMLRSTGSKKKEITVKGVRYQVGISGALKKI